MRAPAGRWFEANSNKSFRRDRRAEQHLKTFAVATFVTTVLAAPEADAQVPLTAFASGAIAHHAAPVHHIVHAAPAAHHTVVHAPVHHAYQAPKHNYSVVDAVESAEVYTLAFETVFESIERER